MVPDTDRRVQGNKVVAAEISSQMEQGNSNDETTIDIRALASDLDNYLRRAEADHQGTASPEYRISTVKNPIRNVTSASGQYTPRSVIVGPNHHNSANRMEPVKGAALGGVLPADDERRLSTLEHYLAVINGLVDQVRQNYDDEAKGWTDKKLTHMLLLDGFYILYSFGVGGFSNIGGGDLSAMDRIEHVRDVFYLLENQIPFFVLEKVYELFFPVESAGDVDVTSKIIVDGFEAHLQPLLQTQCYSVLKITCPPLSRPWHLLHLLHMHFKPTVKPPANANSGKKNKTAAEADDLAHRWYGATQYDDAGVKFKRRRQGRLDGGMQMNSVLDIKLQGLTLWIPRLTVDNNTWRILRNLMALEQQSPADVGTHVTAYCLFISQLAGTAKDVEFLARKGIIVHYMGSHEDVARQFGDLCRGVGVDIDGGGNYLHEMWERMDKRYKSKAINWMALLHRRHLSNPLVVIVMVAAIVGFVCEVIQAVYSIKSYKDSN